MDLNLEDTQAPPTPPTSEDSEPGRTVESPDHGRMGSRTLSEPSSIPFMTASSTPLGPINAARRPAPHMSASALRLGGDLQARMKAVHDARRGAPSPLITQTMNVSGTSPAGAMIGAPKIPGSMTPGGSFVGNPSVASLTLPNARPQPGSMNSAPAIPNMRMNPKGNLAMKRGLKMNLRDAMGTLPASLDAGNAADAGAGQASAENPKEKETAFSKYSEFVDTKTGTLNFKNKAIIRGDGIEFQNGTTFSISLDEVDTLDELGKGNYGTVYQVRHSRPRMRRPGQGLGGNRLPGSLSKLSIEDDAASPATKPQGTGVVMAMKEIRLELDDAKFAAIIMELDILHRCVSPFIVDFYGAFFQEGAVYICMEFMNGGSIDKLYGDGVPESVLRKITLSTVMGLKSLKEDHNIIHRDVKPTNILANSRGQVKICDFGVSGNLVASIAKTNIGCQSYMAPERISSGGMAQAGANPGGGTYSVQSDIWSLGLTIIECAMGRYPYPPETYNNIFSQLSAIVDGDPPDLPAEGFSDQARDFVHACLNKIPKLRPTYAMLTRHPWLAPLLKPPTISEEDEEEPAGDVDLPDGLGSAPPTADKEVATWVIAAKERRKAGKMNGAKKPALHAAPLNAVADPGETKVAAGGD